MDDKYYFKQLCNYVNRIDTINNNVVINNNCFVTGNMFMSNLSSLNTNAANISASYLYSPRIETRSIRPAVFSSGSLTIPNATITQLSTLRLYCNTVQSNCNINTISSTSIITTGISSNTILTNSVTSNSIQSLNNKSNQLSCNTNNSSNINNTYADTIILNTNQLLCNNITTNTAHSNLICGNLFTNILCSNKCNIPHIHATNINITNLIDTITAPTNFDNTFYKTGQILKISVPDVQTYYQHNLFQHAKNTNILSNTLFILSTSLFNDKVLSSILNFDCSYINHIFAVNNVKFNIKPSDYLITFMITPYNYLYISIIDLLRGQEYNNVIETDAKYINIRLTSDIKLLFQSSDSATLKNLNAMLTKFYNNIFNIPLQFSTKPLSNIILNGPNPYYYNNIHYIEFGASVTHPIDGPIENGYTVNHMTYRAYDNQIITRELVYKTPVFIFDNTYTLKVKLPKLQSEWSYQFWLKVDDANTDFIITKWGDLSISFDVATFDILIYINNNIFHQNLNIKINKWTHIGIVYTSRTLYFYIDENYVNFDKVFIMIADSIILGSPNCKIALPSIVSEPDAINMLFDTSPPGKTHMLSMLSNVEVISKQYVPLTQSIEYNPIAFIKLIGPKEYYIQIGDTFKDPGVIAFAPYTVNNSNINTNWYNKYTLIYRTTDKWGNTASVERVVYIIDTKIPFSKYIPKNNYIAYDTQINSNEWTIEAFVTLSNSDIHTIFNLGGKYDLQVTSSIIRLVSAKLNYSVNINITLNIQYHICWMNTATALILLFNGKVYVLGHKINDEVLEPVYIGSPVHGAGFFISQPTILLNSKYNINNIIHITDNLYHPDNVMWLDINDGFSDISI